MPVTIDASELDGLAIDLSNAGEISKKQIKTVMRKGATNIKNELYKEMRKSRHFKGFADFSYDEKSSGDEIEYEIGPNKGGPGSGANIAYFGTSRGGGTVTDPLVTAETEVPNIIGWIEGIADGIL